jgi:hypothetical protein
LGISV